MNRLYGALGLGLGAVFMLLSATAEAADPLARANAIAAADAAAGLPVQQDPGVPVCATPPETGRKLAGDMELTSDGHSIELRNSGMRDALAKIRHADSGRLAASFFVRRQEALSIDGVPDGRYVIQYAFGTELAPDCKSFSRTLKASQMPEVDELTTKVIDDDEKTEVQRSSVSYDISVSESANVKPLAIDAAAFNAE